MATIDNLNKPLDEMNLEEMLELHKKNRHNRTQTPPKRVQEAQKKRKVLLLKKIDVMTPEQKAELLLKIQEGDNE